ncbi:MAG: ABC transporter permease [Clostridia bacterium]|nr:ABC transporter permease [Clostridia bacterium]
MYRYILKRLLMLIPVIIGITLVIYFTMDLAPGDPVYQIVSERASEEEIAAAREEYHLNDPFLVRCGRYLLNLCKGDLGVSYQSKRPVAEIYFSKLPATLALAVASIVIALLISIPLGIYAATHQNSWGDSTSMILSLVGVSMPNFWLGLLLVLAFALHLGWLPSGGMNGFASVILPALTEGAYLAGFMTRTTRSAMLDTIRSDYVFMALAKGVSKKESIMKHAFKNALIPIVTAGGVQFAYVMGGCVVTETVFAWPGIGRQLVEGINQRDIPVVLGFIILTAIVVCIINLMLDIIYAFVDPRIKAQYSK